MFYNIFTNLCNKKGLSPTATLQKLGVSTSKLTAWKKGSSPSASMLILLSEFFEVTIDYLLTGKENQAKLLTDDEQALLENYSKLTEEEKKEVSKKTEELVSGTVSKNTNLLEHIKSVNLRERELLMLFRNLSEREQERLIGRAELLVEQSKFEENVG